MPTFKYAKLVRDNIVDQQIASGAKPSYRQLDPEDHKLALINKLLEEAAELKHAKPDEVLAELADLQQVIDDLCSLYGISAAQVAEVQTAKKLKAGSFQRGIYIESVEVDEDSHWIDYYRNNPDKYPEIKP